MLVALLAQPLNKQRDERKVRYCKGTIIEEEFQAKKSFIRRRARSRNFPVGFFDAGSEWIKTTPEFDLVVAFPFKGENYELIFAVADGMSGHASGATASSMACEGLLEYYAEDMDTMGSIR